MIFNRKKSIKNESVTVTSKEIEDLQKELKKYRLLLEDSARKCYIKNAAMACYIPMEPDWILQGERLREEQEELRTNMGHYDCIRQKMIKLCERELIECHIPKSHVIVELGLINI